MLVIRLRRIGKRNEPSYRLIVSERSKDPLGDYLEALGFYNPRTNPATVSLKGERIQYWLSHGAQVSDTVHNLLVEHQLLLGPKRKVGGAKKKTETPAAPAPKTEAVAEAPVPEKKEPTA